MRKVLIGILLVVVAGIGGYVGVASWAQRAATRHVDAALDRWRARGGTATRGPVAFELWTRTLRVSGIALASRASPDDKVSIGQVVAAGVDRSGAASRVDIVDLEIGSALPGQLKGRIRQKTPRVTLTGVAGRPSAPRRGADALDTLRSWLEQFGTVTAEAVDIPSLTVTVTPAAGDDARDAPGAVEYTYTGIALRDVAHGRIAEATVGNIAVRSATGRRYREFTAEIGNVSLRDIDTAPLLAFLDPTRPDRDGYRRLYRQLAVGPGTLRFDGGPGIGVARIVAEDAGLYPPRLSRDDLMFLAEVGNPAGRPPTDTQLGMLTDKMAGLYEGVHLGKLEIAGLRVDAPSDAIEVARVAVDGLEGGRFARIAVEGLSASAPQRPSLAAGSIALKGFNVANLLRTASRLLTAPERSGPMQVLQALAVVEGVEIKDLALPATGRPVHLRALDASWGRLVEGVPTQLRLSATVRAPVTAGDPEPLIKALAASGIPALTASLDVGAGWTEAAQAVTLAPASIELDDLLAVSLKATAGNVPHATFSRDRVKSAISLALVEAGPIELTLHDLGAVDVAAAEMARAQGQGPEAGRVLLARSLSERAEAVAETTPEMRTFYDAAGEFVRTRGGTLTLTLTPKGRIGLLPLIEGVRRDPVAALLANFTVEARTGR
jgi:hypothetical protein